MDRETFKLLVEAGPPSTWSGAIAASLGDETRRELTRAWRRATKGERARVVAAFEHRHQQEDTMPATYEMDAKERATVRKAEATAKNTDKAEAALMSQVDDALAELDEDSADVLVEALSEGLAMLGLPALSGPEDPKVSRALLVIYALAREAGIKAKLPDFSKGDMAVAELLGVIRDPKFMDFIEDQREKAGEGEGAAEGGGAEDAEPEDGTAAKQKRMDLFRARAR